MKKNFTLLFLFTLAYLPTAFAGGGIWEYYFDTKFNATTKTHGNYNGGTSLNGSVLATGIDLNTHTLIVDVVGIKTWEDGGTIANEGIAYYSVYKQGTSPSAFTSHNLPAFGGLSGNNREWNSGADINLLVGLTETGTYVLEVYFQANATNGGPFYESNNSANFKATFDVATPLPLTLMRFDAKSTNKSVLLSWSTAMESNTDYFEIEKSLDGKIWRTMEQQAAAGNSREVIDYQYEDKTPNTVAYYRLRMVDLDGSFTYSRVLTMQKNTKNNFVLSPNPASDHIRLVLNDATTDNLNVQVYNVLGRLMCSGQVNNNGTFILNQLANDVYFLRISDDNGHIIAQQRFIKE